MRLVKSVIFLLLGIYTIHNPVIGGIVFIPRLVTSIGKYDQKQRFKKKFCFRYSRR